MVRKQRVAIVGPGRLGSALARALRKAGYPISELVVRAGTVVHRRLARELHSRISTIASAKLDADVFWLCTPDGAIASVARALASRGTCKGKIALHSSGALSSRELDSLRSCGASAASAHLMMTFTPGTTVDLRDVAFALEGDRQAVIFARQVARDLRMEALEINPESKVLYHVLGAFSSPLLLALVRAAEDVGQAAGIGRAQARKVVGPLLEQTIRNYRRVGADAAFTGPMARGDVDTVSRHLRELRQLKSIEKIYLDLIALALAELPVRNRAALRNLLRRSAARK
jgi:predicted short-subunit dehydrogenase-like oxidoreductase (DUF2520 family)